MRALPQSTGRAIVWGGFTGFGGVSAPGLTRLETNGLPDATFVLPALSVIDGGVTNAGTVREVGRLADDRLLVLGAFNTVNGTTRAGVLAQWDNIIRLGADGQVEAEYALDFDQLAPGGGYPAVGLRLLETAPDGSAIVSARLDNGLIVSETIFSLGTNGAVIGDGLAAYVDASVEGTYVAAARTPEGSIVSAQQLTGDNISEPRLEKFSGLSIDGSFHSPAFTNTVTRNGTNVPATVHALHVLADGRILVGGDFTHVDGLPRGGVVRLLANGSVDPAFAPGTGGIGTRYAIPVPPFPVTNGPVTSLLPRPDGSIIVGGDFTRFDNQARAGLVRLWEDGRVDSSFRATPGAGRLPAAGSSPLARVQSVASIDTNQVLVAGLFDSINDVARAQVAWVQDGPGMIQLSITASPTNINVRLGQPLLLTAEALGDSPLQIAWYRDGAPVPGATNHYFHLPAAGVLDGGTYTAVAVSQPFLEISPPVNVTVEQPVLPSITADPSPAAVRALVGDTVTFTAAGAGDPPLRLLWFYNGTPMPGETNATLVLTNVGVLSSGGYLLVVSNDFGFAISRESFLTVYDPDNTDRENPVVTVSNVTGRERAVFQSPFTLRGTATDGYYVNLLVIDEQGSNRVVNYLGESPWGVPLSLQFGTNRFQVYGHDLAGNYSVTNDVVLIYDTDTTAPAVTVRSHPGITNRTDNDRPLLSGTVLDQDTALVFVIPPGGAPALANAGGGTNWSREIQLTAGTNVFQVYAEDPSGNRSATNDVVLVYVPKPIFRLTKIGLGDVKGLTNGQVMVAGRRYTVTATPKTGWLFRRWTGTHQTNGASLTFTASSNVVRVTAEFATNRFPQWKGTYAGVFHGPGVPSIASMGDVSLTVSDKGALSGRLRLEGGSHTLAGTLDPVTLETVLTVNRVRTNGFQIAVRLDTAAAGLRVVVTNRELAMPALLVRPTYSATKPVPTNYVGTFTMAAVSDDSLSIGHGYATLTVARAGTYTLSGLLGDGTPFTIAGNVYAPNSVAGFVPLFAGKGAALAALEIPAGTNETMVAALTAVRPPAQPGTLYRAGYQSEFVLVGGRYVAPKAGVRALSFSNAVVSLEGGNVPPPLVGATATLTTANKVVADLPNTNKVALTVTPASGLFTGSFIHPVTRKAAAIKGVLLQTKSVGVGYFPGTNVTGRVFFGRSEDYPLSW